MLGGRSFHPVENAVGMLDGCLHRTKARPETKQHSNEQTGPYTDNGKCQ